MKTKILGLLAVALLTGPLAAQAVTVTVDGIDWNVTASNVSFDTFTIPPPDMPWWGNFALAGQFARAVQNPSWDFAASSGEFNVEGNFSCGPNCTGAFNRSLTISALYAQATRANVPEPGTLALLGLGLTGLVLSRKRKAA